MACTRSMSLTVGKKAAAQKTLESLLVAMDESGKKTSLSTKCAELDLEMPMQLGVLSAILDNVIFCHQEDSYWPLSEPAILKKKFDEIFAATSYTKVLDHIKTLRKEKASDLKTLQAEVNFLKLNKGMAEVIRQQLSDAEAQLTSIQKRIDDLDGGELAQCGQQLQRSKVEIQNFDKLESELVTLKVRREDKWGAIQDISRSLPKQYEESDEEMRRMLKEHEESLRAQDEEDQKLSNQIKSLSSQLARLDESIRERSNEVGRLENQKEIFGEKLSERQKLIRDLAAQHRYGGFTSANLSNSDVERFTAKLEADLQERKFTLNAFKGKCSKQEGDLNTAINTLSVRLSSIVKTKDDNRRQIDKLSKRKDEDRDKISRLKVSQIEIDDRQNALATQERRLATAREGWDAKQSENKEKELNTELLRQEGVVTQLRAEMKQMNAQSEDRASLSLKKTARSQTEQLLQKSLGAITSQFEATLGQIPAPNNMKEAAQLALRQKQTAVRNLEQRVRNQKAELREVDAKLEMLREPLKSKTSNLNACLDRVKAIIGDDDFFEAAARLESAVNQKRDKVAEIESATSMYQKFINSYDNRECCPLCDRGFDKSDGDKFIKKLRERLTRVPEALENAKIALKSSEQKRDALLKLRTDWDDAKRLEQELPRDRQRLTEHQSHKDKLQTELDNTESVLDQLKHEELNVKELHENVTKVVAQQDEISQLSIDIEKLERSLSMAGSTKTRSEVEREEDELQKSCKNIRDAILQLQTRRNDKQTELNAIELDIIRATQQRDKSLDDLKQKQHLQSSLADLEDEIAQLRKNIKSADEAAAMQKQFIREKEVELERVRDENSRVEAGHNVVIQDLESSSALLKAVNKDISSYIDGGGDSRLEQRIAALKAGEQQKAETQKELEALVEDAQSTRNLRASIGETRRQVADTIRLRSHQREFEELQKEIATLQEEIAGKDRASITDQHDRLTQRHNKLSDERSGLKGELRQLQVKIAEYQSVLTSDYRNVDHDYLTQLKNLRMQEMANADIEKYAKALDNAIMKFHSLKMEEINKIIRELWVNTYQGSDIDTIEIRSDNENLVGNRAYNYRVVMLKGDTPLDMRGRCSAGQKVLTCLIIRLALAETFCLNCGVLALDEPTTNLDRDNIESLAESLANIIKLRRGQANFQLIIITHDEEFMRLLGRSEHADHFWRVSKDDEGHSVLTQENMSEA
ncbi:DNA repair protein rad50 [Geranomyces variabilis]|uniref:DNA repair protein rad50 n=1 Tax=Geranomyces variabilis TaxID=109894 RepID=A0AAD5XMU7_9FUNG|nr:DNA repair protein rad50 [Geranomyces variabilis]